MTQARAILMVLLLPALIAVVEQSAIQNPASEASLWILPGPGLPALPDQPAKLVYKACDWTCTDQCDDYFQSCAAECPGFRGDPCLTDCRNGRIACYQGCGCL